MSTIESQDLPAGALPAAAAHPRSRSRKILTRALLVLGGTIFALLLCEVACRIVAAHDNHNSFEMAITESRTNNPGSRVALIDILQASDNDKIIFELKPHMPGLPFKDAPVSTNRFGFRGPEYDAAAAPNTITILGIGDSVMFGYGVPDGRDYLSIVERHLNQKYPQKSWRCINTAVPAYNTVIEVETLKTKGLDFAPDLVILGLVPNDLVLPPFIRIVDDVYDLKRSFLFDRLVRGTSWAKNRNGFELTDGRDSQLLFLKGVDGARENLPEKYKAMQGIDGFKTAIGELEQMSKEHGFPVVIFTNTEDYTLARMLQATKSMGWTWIRLLPDLNQFLKAHGGGRWDPDHPEAYLASELAVTPDDGHPSMLQHSMAARRIMDDLEKTGIIDRLLAK